MAVSVVPLPGADRTSSVPPIAASRSRSPVRPVDGGDVGGVESLAVVGDVDPQVAVVESEGDRGLSGVAVFEGVGKRFADGEVGRALDRRR